MDLHVSGYLSAEPGSNNQSGWNKKKKSGLRCSQRDMVRALRVRICAGASVIETAIWDQGWPPPAGAPARGGVTPLPAGMALATRGLFQAGKRMLGSSPCSLEFQGLLQIPEHRGYVNTNYISMPSNFVSSFLLKHLVPSAVGISIQPPPSSLLTVNWALRLIRARVRNSEKVDSNIPLLVPPRTSCCYLLNILKSLLPKSPGDIYLP